MHGMVGSFMIASLLTILFLAMMEVALSFDNAVLNAGVLKTMSTQWQNRFLTWGLGIAVVGMRLVFPVLIVSLAGSVSIPEVVHLAVYEPSLYAAQLAAHHVSISSFGGMFLLLVFLGFMLNPDGEREVFWLGALERKFTQLGLLKGIEIAIAVTILVGVQYSVVQESERLACLLAGLLGIVVYILLDAFKGILSPGAIHSGLIGFLYLEVLDASCSLDGVIGAFVLTNNILLIMTGLGIGAAAIRSLTVRLVRGGVLQEYIYLEHGAHYGIGALAGIMLVDTFYTVPEPVTGMMGILFIGASVISSVVEMKQNANNQ